MSDIVTTRIFSNGETGITAAKMNDIIGGSSIQTDFVASKPAASSTTSGDQLLLLKADGSYARIDSSVFASSIAAILPSPDPEIWNVRLRSYNALGASNPTFEIDQRQAATAGIVNVAAGTMLCDRWSFGKSGTMTCTVTLVSPSSGQEIVVPGTNFEITSKFLRVTLTGQQASLGASDQFGINTIIEGPMFRELAKDVHSISLLVRSTVAGLKFGLVLRDPPTISKSLLKLCTIPNANTWTLIQLPNLPVWPAGNFATAPGGEGYRLGITLGAGSTLTAAANDSFQSANVLAALGQDNFASKPVSSTFDIAFIQHEPTAQCSTLMDCPWQQAYDAALRYYCKSYDYDVAPGAVSALGIVGFMQASTTQIAGSTRFHKPLARTPTLTGYNHATGATGTVRHQNGSDFAISNFPNIGKAGIYAVNTAAMPAVAAGAFALFHYTADTGW